MKFNAFRSLLLALILVSIFGCSGDTATSRDACVENLEILRSAAKSYALEKNLSDSTIINPDDLAGFLKHGQVPKCPLGTTSYKPFTLGAGPACPNNPAHTSRFREMEKKK
jgi:hypothetical protein